MYGMQQIITESCIPLPVSVNSSKEKRRKNKPLLSAEKKACLQTCVWFGQVVVFSQSHSTAQSVQAHRNQ